MLDWSTTYGDMASTANVDPYATAYDWQVGTTQFFRPWWGGWGFPGWGFPGWGFPGWGFPYGLPFGWRPWFGFFPFRRFWF